jgi:hypothetical protein
MLGIPIFKMAQPHNLVILFLAATAITTFSSCASEQPKTALVSDPDARGESSIPWNRPANWEGRGNLPPGVAGTGQDPFGQSGNGGTGGY